MSWTKSGTGIRAKKGHAGGVRGSLQAAVGLASALTASGAVAQEAPQAQRDAEEQYVLPTVEVVEEAEGYTAPDSSLTRLPKPLVDTPQSVTVVPRKVIEEQRATTVRDALRNVSGITISAGEGGRQGDTFQLRGFSAQTDTFRDGVRDLGWFTRDTFNLGGVEAFFGPSSVLFGRGSTGGAVNLVTKKPGRRSFWDVRMDAGTAPSGRFELDVNQAISDRFQVRVSAFGQLAAVAGRDQIQENRAGIAPSARIELGERTSVEVDYFYQREDSVPDYGHPYFNGAPVSANLGVPRNAFYGVKGSDAERVNVHIGTARLEHGFGAGTTLTNTLRVGGVDRFARPTAPRGVTPTASPTTVGRQRFETETDNAYLVNQTDLRGTFSTGLLRHTLSGGLELSRETREQARNNLQAQGLPTGPNILADLYAPDPLPDLTPVSKVFNNSNSSAQWTAGVYASDQVEITQYLELLGSARLDVFDTDYTATDAKGVVTELNSTDRFFNWRVGFVVHPVEKASLYGTYGTSANPSAEAGTLTDATVSLEPERNVNYEVGAKADLVEDHLSVNAAVFRVEKLNGRVPSGIEGGPPQILAGKQRVQGVAAGLAGTVVAQWKVFANYTFMDSKIREHTSAYLVGQPLPNTPKHSLSLWTTYGVTDDLMVGGGAVYQDVATVNNPASADVAFNKVPNFWRFDALLRYVWGPAELQLNLNNVTDALYYEQSTGGHAVPAEGRSAILSGKVRFD